MLAAQRRNRFVAIDVETANADMASICQIGGVVFEDGAEVSSFSYLIDPEDDFDSFNVMLHGIDAQSVAGSPTLGEVADDLADRLHDEVIVSHTHFDRVSLRQAFGNYSIPPLTGIWLDSAMIARRAWKPDWFEAAGRECSYKLSVLADALGITFRHHDAEQDARACGLIVLEAMRHSALDLDGWRSRCQRPVTTERLKLVGGEGPLADQVICFTGSLQITRNDAAQLANSFGAAVDSGVTKRTTLLVVGDQDILRLNGTEKSRKHLKAEGMIAKGHPLRVLRETDFAQLCDLQYL